MFAKPAPKKEKPSTSSLVLFEELKDSYERYSALFLKQQSLHDEIYDLERKLHHLNKELAVIDRNIGEIEPGIIEDEELLRRRLVNGSLTSGYCDEKKLFCIHVIEHCENIVSLIESFIGKDQIHSVETKPDRPGMMDVRIYLSTEARVKLFAELGKKCSEDLETNRRRMPGRS